MFADHGQLPEIHCSRSACQDGRMADSMGQQCMVRARALGAMHIPSVLSAESVKLRVG